MNESCRSDAEDLLSKYRQLEQNSTDPRNHFKTLQNKYNERQAEMVVLKNKTYLLEHKLAALQQLKTVNQLQSLTTLQKVQTLDTSVMSFLRQEKTRDQISSYKTILRVPTLCVVLVVNNGFLLDDKNSQQSGLHSKGDNQYVTLSKYIDDKAQMNLGLAKLRSEQEETLHLLASQLKEKFSENGIVNSKADHE